MARQGSYMDTNYKHAVQPHTRGPCAVIIISAYASMRKVCSAQIAKFWLCLCGVFQSLRPRVGSGVENEQ